jgi:DNA-binding NtrC family response regulator
MNLQDRRASGGNRLATQSLLLVAGADAAVWTKVQHALQCRFPLAFAVDTHGTLDLLQRGGVRLVILCSDLLDASLRQVLEQITRHGPKSLRCVVLAPSGRTLAAEPAGDAAAEDNGRETVWVEPRSMDSTLLGIVEALLDSAHRDDAIQRCGVGDRGHGLPAEPPIIGQNKAMRKLNELIPRIARVDVPVLLCGETGTGKELFARMIHRLSSRARQPLRTINMAAIPTGLFDSTLFGHERGAFTGAVAASLGVFQQADKGTLLLDEICSTPMEGQAKLLRVLQEGEVQTVGAQAPKQCDVRIVAASNRNLRDCVAAGQFREDLYHRLSVVRLHIPPLRERREDIPELVCYFLHKHARRHGREVPEVSAEAMQELTHREWTGNVRELESSVQRALIFSTSGRLTTEDFFASETWVRPVQRTLGPVEEMSLAEMEQNYVARVLERANGNQSQAARILNIDRKTLRLKLKRLPPEGSDAFSDSDAELTSRLGD